MTPRDARDAALRTFGNIALAKEDVRAVWIPIWSDQLLQDTLRGAHDSPRSRVQRPRHPQLALGMGLTTAAIGVVNAVLVRPLRSPAGDRLVWVATRDESPGTSSSRRQISLRGAISPHRLNASPASSSVASASTW